MKNKGGFTPLEILYSEENYNGNYPSKESRKFLTGFTLIEFMVVIFIIFIFSSLILINYSTFRKNLAMERAGIKLAQDIRDAQGMAIASQPYPACGSPAPIGYKSGYGIYLSSAATTTYFIFADCNGNSLYDNPGDQKIGNIDIQFEQGISIQGLSAGGIAVNSLQVVFIPPNPLTIINSLSNIQAGIVITNDLNQHKTISVNAVGLIDVN